MGKPNIARCKWSRSAQHELVGIKGDGHRPLASKCRSDRMPGQHWQRRGRTTDYGTQLRMKQLIRRYYNLLEKQFRNYYAAASRCKGSTGYHLLRLLESRLDNVVYRMGFAVTRPEARQLISHKAILVNERSVNIASYSVQPGDSISIRARSQGQLRIKSALELSAQRSPASWLETQIDTLSGQFKSYPDASDFPPIFKVNLVVELYSK